MEKTLNHKKKKGSQESDFCVGAQKQSVGTSASRAFGTPNPVSFLPAVLAGEENPHIAASHEEKFSTTSLFGRSGSGEDRCPSAFQNEAVFIPKTGPQHVQSSSGRI